MIDLSPVYCQPPNPEPKKEVKRLGDMHSFDQCSIDKVKKNPDAMPNAPMDVKPEVIRE